MRKSNWGKVPLVSILYLTIDRWPSARDNLLANLTRGGIPADGIELLWCDNGSKSEELIDAFKNLSYLSYARLNRENEGITRALNQLIIRTTGRHIVQLGNDYEMPDGWLRKMVEYAEVVEGAGMVGIPWCPGHRGEITDVGGGVRAHLNGYTQPMFGVKLLTRAMLDHIGGFDEKLHPYGLCDTDMHQRACLAGFKNFYIPDLMSKHLGTGDADKGEYRQMKDFSIKANGPYFVTKDYRRFGYYVPFPPMNDGYQREGV